MATTEGAICKLKYYSRSVEFCRPLLKCNSRVLSCFILSFLLEERVIEFLRVEKGMIFIFFGFIIISS